MVHKIDDLKSKEKEIRELQQRLKILDVEQKRQAVEEQVKHAEFMTKHKHIREGIQDLKSGLKFGLKSTASGLRQAVHEYKHFKGVGTRIEDIKKKMG